MHHPHPILVTGAAGRVGAIGPVVTKALLDRGFKVRAMVSREDERSMALRRLGAEVAARRSPLTWLRHARAERECHWDSAVT